MSFEGETEMPMALTVAAPKALRRWSSRRGCPPLHWEWGLSPSPEIFSIFELQNASFCAFWLLFLQLN